MNDWEKEMKLQDDADNEFKCWQNIVSAELLNVKLFKFYI